MHSSNHLCEGEYKHIVVGNKIIFHRKMGLHHHLLTTEIFVMQHSECCGFGVCFVLFYVNF